MPVLIGTPSLVLASRVEVYHTCSVDLTWQRAIHSCQRCPRAVLVTNNVAIAPITQSNVERATSRFCPAGVHMSNCVPASEIFSAPLKQAVLKPQQTGLTGTQTGLSSPGLNLSPSAWGPPNLPVPAVTHHHPVHTIHSNRSSYPPVTGTSFTAASTPATISTRDTEKITSPGVQQELIPTERAKLVVPKSKDVDKGSSSDKIVSPPESPIPTSPSIKQEVTPKSPSPVNDVGITRAPASEISIIRENEVPKSPAIPPISQEPSQVNGVASDRVISVPHNEPIKSAEREISLTNHESETTNDSRTSDSSSVKKQRKEDTTNQSIARSKSGITSDGSQTPDVEISVPSRGSSRGTAHDEEPDKIRPNRTSSRSSERSTTGSTKHQPSSPVPSSVPSADSQKPDSTTVSHGRHQSSASSLSSGRNVPGSQSQLVPSTGGGLGDVDRGPTKSNGTVRSDVARPSSVEPQTPPASKQPTAPSLSMASRKAVPSFHFPLGTTRMTAEEIAFEVDRAKRELNRVIDGLQNGTKNVASDPQIPYSSFGQVAKALNCPLYWKYTVYSASGGTGDHQPITLSAVLKMWNQVLTSCPDETARFVHMLTRGRATHLVQADFNPLIQDILESHPGLAFLQAAKDFHSRYVATVVARIFYNVNTSWSGRITLGELRRSNFLSVLASLEDEEDINLVTQYFSYEHFYVIYCKFWELDEDHDLIISRSDLARHNNYAISERMIDRIFSGTVTRGTAFKEGVMTYPDFVWFLLAEEDKRHPRSIEYWFRCMDLDGDGLLSMYELEYFYSEQVARMEEMGIEPISFEDCLCQCLDMVKPELGDKIRLSDMKQCRLCHIFFDTFFNLPKYLQHEQRDPFANLRDIEEGLNELSDWDRYAAEAYEMLVAVEGGNQEDGVDDEDGEDEDLEEEHDVESPSPALGSKADVAVRKDNGVSPVVSNTKLDTPNSEHSPLGSAAAVGAGE